MIVNWFKTAFKRRHFWRKATFSELSALYIFKIMRLLAFNLGSVFILVYMYRIGYSLLFIAGYYTVYALICAIFTPLAAYLTAKMGAKKVLLISEIIFVLMMICFALIDQFGLKAIIASAVLSGLGVVLYQVSHDVIFSEVKTADNAGKEIGYMFIFVKVTAIVGPILGGLISNYLGPQTSLILAAILFIVSTFPLFRAQGNAKKSHYFKIRGFPFRAFTREYLFHIGLGFDSAVAKIWPVFLAMAIFSVGKPYLMIGLMHGIGAFICIFVAYWAGKVIDNSTKTGRKLFKLSSLGVALTILWRAFIVSPLNLVANVIVHDSVFTIQNIVTMRAHFDSADRSGSRVVYLMFRHLAWNLFSFVAGLVLMLCLWLISDQTYALRIYFVIAALFSSTFTFSNYRLYRK